MTASVRQAKQNKLFYSRSSCLEVVNTVREADHSRLVLEHSKTILPSFRCFPMHRGMFGELMSNLRVKHRPKQSQGTLLCVRHSAGSLAIFDSTNQSWGTAQTVILYVLCGSWDSFLVEHLARDWKIASSNPGRVCGRIFFPRLKYLCWLLFGVHSTPVLLQRHVKATSFCQMCRRQVTPKHAIHLWSNEAGVGWLCHCSVCQRNSVWAYPEMR